MGFVRRAIASTIIPLFVFTWQARLVAQQPTGSATAPPVATANPPSDDLEQGIKVLAMQLSEAMAGQVKKLAVVEFPDLGGYQSLLGQFVAEELITQISVGSKRGQFDIVE